MKVLIIGGVAGGAGTAARLRRNDENAQIIMIEKGPYISFANCGLPYFIGGEITDEDELQLQTPESFHDRFNVDVRILSEAIKIKPDQKTVAIKNRCTDETYIETYDVLVLSPGARPVSPPIEGADLDHVMTLRTIPDTLQIQHFIETRKPQKAVVIGSGYIGVEMAENLCKAGLDVDMIEAQNHVIAPLDAEMASFLHAGIRQQGIGLHLNSQVTAIRPDQVVLNDGRQIQADLVLMSIGVKPETDFLKSSGIELGQRGELIVDDQMKTNQPDVYGLGDAAATKNIVTGTTRVIPLASPANRQARITADVICGKSVRYQGAQGTAIARVFGQTAATTGESESTLLRQGIPFRKSYTFSNSNAGYYPGSETMAIKLLFDNIGRMLGASIVGGKGVDKRIDVLAAALRSGLTVWDLQDLELAYAPPYSSAKDPVNMAGYAAGNILDKMMHPFYAEDISGFGPNDVLLDVRTLAEHRDGSIPGSVNIPVDDLRHRLSELDDQKHYRIYCAVGLRGYIAQRILVQNHIKASNLSGGYTLWESMDRDSCFSP